jgi:hypothetical protein
MRRLPKTGKTGKEETEPPEIRKDQYSLSNQVANGDHARPKRVQVDMLIAHFGSNRAFRAPNIGLAYPIIDLGVISSLAS